VGVGALIPGGRVVVVEDLSSQTGRCERRGLYPRPSPRSRARPPADSVTASSAGEPIATHRVPTGIDLLALHHVALAVADPAAMAAFLCDHVGMHELVRNGHLLVVGAGTGAAAVSLVAAEGPREPGALERLVLRVADVERALAALPAATEIEGDRFELATFEGPEGLGLGFTMVAGGGIDYDLDQLVLRVSDIAQTSVALAEIGCVPRGAALHVADKSITLHGSPGSAARPLLHHIALRVESVEAVSAKARERELAIDEPVGEDAFAIVLPGPEQIRLRFVGPLPT
jgi:catechol 2,3-dioxygenase-like lactoylglutathione lyase family enzyme